LGEKWASGIPIRNAGGPDWRFIGHPLVSGHRSDHRIDHFREFF